MTVAIVTDSASDLDAATAQALGIQVMPFYVHIGERSLRDRVDLSAKEFYHHLAEGPVMPRTSQPTPADFITVFQSVARPEGILSIHVASQLSGTYNSALLARSQAAMPTPIDVVDSGQAAIGQGLLVLGAAQRAKQGSPLRELTGWLQGAIPRAATAAALPTLEYAYKSGRLDWARAFLGGLLHMCPVIVIRHGEIKPSDRPRSWVKAIDRLVAFAVAEAPLEAAAVAHCDSATDAQTLAERVREATGISTVPVFEAGPVVGGYAGPGALFLGILKRRTPS